jgi:arylsulfatase A-like enzyme
LIGKKAGAADRPNILVILVDDLGYRYRTLSGL